MTSSAIATRVHALPLRSALAWNVRLCWRALKAWPALLEPAHQQGCHLAYRLLAMAEAVAEGQSVAPMQASISAHRLEELGALGRGLAGGAQDAHAALVALADAALDINALVEGGGRQSGLLQDIERIRAALDGAASSGLDALGIHDAGEGNDANDANDAMANVLAGDLDAIQRVFGHQATDYVLGQPCRAGERGPLGPLEPIDTNPSSPPQSSQVVDGHELALSMGVGALARLPMVACWSLDGHVGHVCAQRAVEDMTSIARHCQTLGVPKPVFAVHARHLEPHEVADLTRAGATIITDIRSSRGHVASAQPDLPGAQFRAWMSWQLRDALTTHGEQAPASLREAAALQWRWPDSVHAQPPAGVRRDGHGQTPGWAGQVDAPAPTPPEGQPGDPYAEMAARSRQAWLDARQS